jgi:hypothetical protein
MQTGRVRKLAAHTLTHCQHSAAALLFCNFALAVSPGEGVRAWSDAIGEAFLDPFAVGAHSSSVTTLGTRGRVHERVVQQAPSIPFLTAGTQDRWAYAVRCWATGGMVVWQMEANVADVA